MSCENCKFATVRKRTKLIREQWEEDPRPIRKGWSATWWNPHDYKDADPYENMFSEICEICDEAREVDNNTLINCDRFPQRKEVNKSYQCGEFISLL
jgi:hypothetical protein